jgi:hypothetical protein
MRWVLLLFVEERGTSWRQDFDFILLVESFHFT